MDFPYEVFFGNLVCGDNKRKLLDELRRYSRSMGTICMSPGFAFIQFDDPECADRAVHDLNGKNGWLVEHHHGNRCYDCGEFGHISRNCSPETGRRDPNHNRSRSHNRRGNRSHMNQHRASHN